MKFLFLSFIISFVFSSEIFVATSSNLTYVMPEIVKQFNKKYPNIHVKIIISSSGKLASQILRGAPYDIFLSADMKYPSFLYSNGIGIEKPKVYAIGKIGLISFKYKNFNNLIDKKIVISKPSLTPYGRAAKEFLENKGIYNKIKNNLIFAETISSVIYYVKNGADVGIISKSLIYSKNIENLGKFYYKDINCSLYSPIKQGVLLINNKKEAKIFYNFLLKKGKMIFKRYGYE